MARGKKTGGRKKSSLNKIPKDLRASITEFLQENFETVVSEWNALETGKEKLAFYKDLLKYAVPTVQSIEHKGDSESNYKNGFLDLMKKALQEDNKDSNINNSHT